MLPTFDVFFQIANLQPYKKGEYEYTISWDEENEEMEVSKKDSGNGMSVYGTQKEIHMIIRELERNDVSYGEYLCFIADNNMGGQNE